MATVNPQTLDRVHIFRYLALNSFKQMFRAGTPTVTQWMSLAPDAMDGIDLSPRYRYASPLPTLPSSHSLP